MIEILGFILVRISEKAVNAPRTSLGLRAGNIAEPVLCNTSRVLRSLWRKESQPFCPSYGSGGWGFESLRACHQITERLSGRCGVPSTWPTVRHLVTFAADHPSYWARNPSAASSTAAATTGASVITGLRKYSISAARAGWFVSSAQARYA